MTGVEPATSRVTSEVTVVYTTAKLAPGISDKGREPLRVLTQSWREVTLICHHGQKGSGSASCTRDLQVMRLTRCCSSVPLKWSLEKCSHLRLLLFRQALGLSQLSRGKWCPGPGSNRHAEARGSQPTRVCLIPPPGRIGARRENRTLTLLRRQCLKLLRLPVPPDGQNGAAHRSRTCTDWLLRPDPLPIGVLPRLPRRESNAQGCA